MNRDGNAKNFKDKEKTETRHRKVKGTDQWLHIQWSTQQVAESW